MALVWVPLFVGMLGCARDAATEGSEVSASAGDATESGESATTGEDTGPDSAEGWVPPPPCTPATIIENNNLIANSQAELDALTGVCGIKGELRVRGDDIHDLAPLAQLQWVEGYLSIRACPELSSLAPLTNLQYLGGGFSIGGSNTALTDLHGLEHLQRVSFFHVGGVPSVEGLPAQLEVGEWNGAGWGRSIEFDTISGLTSLDQLPTLIPLYDSESDRMSIELNALPQLESLVGIEVLLGPEPGRVLLSLHELGLEDLGGLESVSSLVGLDLDGLAELTSFDGAENLSSLEFLAVRGAASLADFSGLDSLSSLDILQLGRDCVDSSEPTDDDNPLLVDFTGLESLTTLAEFYASAQSQLMSFAGLVCPEGVYLRYNPLLEDEVIADYTSACAIDFGEPATNNCGNGGQAPCDQCPPN